MLDYDPSKKGFCIKSSDEMMQVLSRLSSIFENTAYCARGSLSAGVHQTGQLPTANGGFHLYIPVNDASDIPRFGKALFQRLWLAGFGHIDLSANGSLLVRSIIDATVFSAERLDFVGAPIVGDGLDWTPPELHYRKGGYLDTRALFDLDIEESEQIESFIIDAKKAAQPFSECAKSTWTNQKIQEMVSRGISKNIATLEVHSISANESTVLPPNFPLTFDGLGVYSVFEVLADQQRFDEKALADPIEGVEYGKTTAKFWANESSNGSAYIHSMAHGGKGYQLSQKNISSSHNALIKEVCSKIEIRLSGGDLPKIVNQCEEVLLEIGGYYQRGGIIVRIVHSDKRSKTSLSVTSIVPVDAVHLSEAVMMGSNVLQLNAKTKKWVPVDLPIKYTNTYLSRKSWKLPNLVGIIHAPTLRADGSILDKPGYDLMTGLYFDPGSTVFLPIPTKPTLIDAQQALETLLAPFKEFKFKEPSDLSTAISAILTALIRRSIDNAPLFLITAPTMGTGKGLLANAISQIAIGTSAPAMSQASDQNEEKKRLIALLIEGCPIICIDNIDKPLSSDTLCTVLTMPVLKDRILGKTQMISAPTNALFLATGNNVEVVGDLTRRVLSCRIDSEIERPHERKFSINLLSYVAEHRAVLVQAALTIIRAYDVAGRPSQSVTEFGSFELWSKWVRCALIWTGMSDPNQGLKRIESADIVRRELACVLEAWYLAFESEPHTVNYVMKITLNCEENSFLRDALFDVAGSKDGINSRTLGRWLTKHIDRIEHGYCLESMPPSGTRSRYRVRQIES